MWELRAENYGGYKYALYHNGALVERLQLNKRELAHKRQQVEQMNATAQAPEAVKQPSALPTHRTVELLSKAQAAGKPMGRAWVADGWTVDKHSLPPEWEGDLVCYVYTT